MTEKGEEMREERKGRVKRQTDRQTDRAKLWNTDWGGGGGGEIQNVIYIWGGSGLGKEEWDFPQNLHCVVCFIVNKRYFESFMCVDLIFER